MAVGEQAILDALRQVPVERWDEVLHFLETLKNDVSPIRTGADMAKSELVGLWADRDDIGDSRELRGAYGARPRLVRGRRMLLDTDVMIDVARNYPPAITWLIGVGSVGLPGLVAMELLQGCRNLTEQRRLEKQLQRYTLHWPTLADCQRSYQDFAAYRLSHGLGLIDALIGATAVGLGETLATFNVKHFAVIAGLTTVQPY